MVYKYISFKNILNKLYVDLNLTTEINESHVIQWCAEVLEKIGAYSQYIELNTDLTLTNGTVQLPANFDNIVYLTHDNKPLSWSTNNSLGYYNNDPSKIPRCCTTHTFYISNNILITDINSSDHNQKVHLTYLGTEVDTDGYPMIPDNIMYSEACVKYVTYMLDYREWRKGNIPDKVLQKSEQEYLFYINAAKGAANMPNERQLRNLKNIMTKLIPNQNDEDNFFFKNSQKERRFRY